MDTAQRLRASLEAFESIQSDFARNSDQHDPAWRRHLVGLRKNLQDSLIAIRTALQAYEEKHGRSEAGDALAKGLSAMRSAIALHQAEWPAVAIDTESQAYRAAVRTLRAATREFHAVANRMLTAITR